MFSVKHNMQSAMLFPCTGNKSDRKPDVSARDFLFLSPSIPLAKERFHYVHESVEEVNWWKN